MRNSEQKQIKLTNEIKPLKIDLQKLVMEHREVELVLRGKKFRMETEVDNWISKYDEVSQKFRNLRAFEFFNLT